jgi:histone H3/H4
MTPAERKARSRELLKKSGMEEITFRVSSSIIERLQELARRMDMQPVDVVVQLVTAAKLPRKPR